MIIHLGKPTRAQVISSVIGQLSDGIWENSSAMNKYWQFANVNGTNLEIDDELYIRERDYSYRSYRTKSIRNGFAGMSEGQIREWFANKAKQVVKIWAEDYGKDSKAVWDRNNTDEVDYMHNVTVADVYECYDFLKGRSGKKYGAAPVEASIDEPSVSPAQMDDSEYAILVLTPDWELSDDARTENRAIENCVFYLTRDLKNLSEVSSIKPAKISFDEEGAVIELPILFNVSKVSSNLWNKIRSIAWEHVLTAERI